MTIAKAFRLLLVFAAILIVAWSFGDVAIRSFQDPKAGRDVMLRIVFWGDANERNIVQACVDAFEAANPRIKVQMIHADFGNFDAKLKTMMAAGTPPDLFYLRDTDIESFAKLKLIEPLEEYIARDPQPWFSDFYPVLLDAFRFDGKLVGNGTLYGLPKDFTTVGFYINLDLFRQAGVPVPRDGWTWEQFDDAARKITALERTASGEKIYGVFMNAWPAVLRNIIWSYGGDFFPRDAEGNYDFTRSALSEPPARAALEMIRRQRFDEKTSYNPTGQAREGGQEFFTGNIGIIGPEGRWRTPRYREITAFDFDFVPVPHLEGKPPVSAIFTVAWAISHDTPHKAESWELLKFLAGPEGQRLTGRLGLAIPSLKSVAESDDFLQPGTKPASTPLFLDLVSVGRIGLMPQLREFESFVAEETTAAISLGRKTVDQATADIERRWTSELASPLKRGEFQQVNWAPVIGTVAAVLSVLLGILIWRARAERLGSLDRAQERAGLLFISPWIIGFALLTLGPMVLSAVLAFTRWSAMTPVSRAEYVGVSNFTQLFKYDDTFGQSLWVTLYFVVLAVPLTQVAALAVAMLMNQAVKGIAIFRTIYFLPSVISGVALGTLWLALFNNDYGLLNRMLAVPLGWIGLTPPDWFGRDAEWFAIPAFVIMSLWGVGAGMVIYLAGLKNIPASLYEAARIDGTTPWQTFRNITLPMLSPLVFFNLVMGIIGSFQVFTQAFVMTGRGPGNATLFYVLNLYYQAFEFHNMGYASAMAWVLFAIILAVTLLVFRAARNLVYYEALKG